MVFTKWRKGTENNESQTQVLDAVNELTQVVTGQPQVITQDISLIVEKIVDRKISARMDAMETRFTRIITKGFTEISENIPSGTDYVQASEKAENEKERLRNLKSIRDELLHLAKQTTGNLLIINKEGNKLKCFTDIGWRSYSRLTELISRLAEVNETNPEKYENHWVVKRFFKKIGESYKGKESAYVPKENKNISSVRANIFSRGYAAVYINYVIDNFIQPEIDALERK